MSVCTNMTKKAYTRNGSASRSSCQAGAARLTRGRITRGPQGGGATRKEARELMLPPRMYVGRAALIAATKTQAAASSSAPSTAWLAPQVPQRTPLAWLRHCQRMTRDTRPSTYTRVIPTRVIPTPIQSQQRPSACGPNSTCTVNHEQPRRDGESRVHHGRGPPIRAQVLAL